MVIVISGTMFLIWAQEMVFTDYPTSEQTDKELEQFKDSVPSVLKTLKTTRRFTTKINEDNTTTLVFGGGNLHHLMNN